MRILGVVILMLEVASAQLTIPEKGWALVEKGEDKIEGKRTLGVWQNEEKTVMVGAAWDEKLPEAGTLYDIDFSADPGLYDPSHLPEKATLLAKPRLGLKIVFTANDEERTGRMEHYWIYGKEGGVFLKVFLKGEAEFALDDWKVDGKVEDPDGKKKKVIEEAVKRTAELFPPTIRLDPDLTAEAAMKAKEKEFQIVVLVKAGGVYEFEGEKVELAALQELLGKAAKEAGEKGVLYIRASKDTEFKFVQRVIKAGAAAGLKRVAYAAFREENGEK